MASGQIRMTPDTMRGRAGEYRTEAENVQNVIDKMDRLLDTLLTEWEGAASEAYAEKNIVISDDYFIFFRQVVKLFKAVATDCVIVV